MIATFLALVIGSACGLLTCRFPVLVVAVSVALLLMPAIECLLHGDYLGTVTMLIFCGLILYVGFAATAVRRSAARGC